MRIFLANISQNHQIFYNFLDTAGGRGGGYLKSTMLVCVDIVGSRPAIGNMYKKYTCDAMVWSPIQSMNILNVMIK